MLYSDWSLQMGQTGTKMTLGTLTMSGDDFPGVQGFLSGSNSIHDIISDTVTQCTAHKRGISNVVTVGQNHLFKKKVVINLILGMEPKNQVIWTS